MRNEGQNRFVRGVSFALLGTILGGVVHAAFRQGSRGIAINHADEAVKFYTRKMGFREAFTVQDHKGQPSHPLTSNASAGICIELL